MLRRLFGMRKRDAPQYACQHVSQRLKGLRDSLRSALSSPRLALLNKSGWQLSFKGLESQSQRVEGGVSRHVEYT
jgi:hypothetical protein